MTVRVLTLNYVVSASATGDSIANTLRGLAEWLDRNADRDFSVVSVTFHEDPRNPSEDERFTSELIVAHSYGPAEAEQQFENVP